MGIRITSIILIILIISPSFAYDAVIVLGHAAIDNKTQISNEWKQRINLAAQFVNENYSRTIILSGKYSDLAYNYTRSLTNATIIIENKSLDTDSNAVYTRRIVEEHNWTNILIVTSDYHVERARNDFNFAYGPGYNLTFSGANTHQSFIGMIEAVIVERAKTIFNNIILLGINPGDDAGIMRRLKEFNPRYVMPWLGL